MAGTVQIPQSLFPLPDPWMSGLAVAATTVGEEGLRYKTVTMARGEREEQFSEAVIAILYMSDPLVVAEQGVYLSRAFP